MCECPLIALTVNTEFTFGFAAIAGVSLSFVFGIRYAYFIYKYDKYVKREHPERIKDFRIAGLFLSLSNMFRRIDIDDARMVGLQRKVRHSLYGILLSMLAGFLVPLIIVIISGAIGAR